LKTIDIRFQASAVRNRMRSNRATKAPLAMTGFHLVARILSAKNLMPVA
jgi:hypothetical protein